MRYGPLVFLAAFFALAASWFGLVFTPQIQLGRSVQATNSVATDELYPMDRPGLARQGLEVYRANGCAYCHSQQVYQKGTLVDVFLTEVGTNAMNVAQALEDAHAGTFSGPGLAAGLPKPVVRNLSMDDARSVETRLKNVGAKSELHLVPVGTDIERGWGARRTVAQDFIVDATVMPGSQRVGPDLANVGLRSPDLNWHLVHLYNPKLVTEDSPMPAYPFLFEEKKIGNQPSPDALQPIGKFAPREGYEIVPKPAAVALANYLVSLRANTPLYEAPLTPPPAPKPATNAPAAK